MQPIPMAAPTHGAAPGGDARLDDFEPKWFAQLPDPVYQLMHPSKCCWCMCAIPAGAICVTVLALASGLLAGLSVPLAYGGAAVVDVLADMPANATAPDAWTAPAQQRGPMAAAAWWAAPTALRWAQAPGGFGDDTVEPASPPGLPELPSGAQAGSPEFAREMHATADWMRLSAAVQGVEALALVAVALAAVPGLLCDGSPLLLRQSAEARFALVPLRIAAGLLLTLASPTFTPGGLFSAGLSALFTFVFGVHFAGVVYQAARLKHYEATRGAAPALGGGEAVPPPAVPGTFADLGQPPLAPGGVAPGVRVHTSGVVQSGV